MAIERASTAENIHNAKKLAKDYEEYIQGSAELPEYEGTHKGFKEMLAKMQLPSLSMWISVNSEVKPEKDQRCIVQTKSGNHYFGTYDNGWYVNHKPVGDDIVAWFPIPKYETTL